MDDDKTNKTFSQYLPWPFVYSRLTQAVITFSPSRPRLLQQQKTHAVPHVLFPSGWRGGKLCLLLVSYVTHKAWRNIKAIVIVRSCSPPGYGCTVCFSVRKSQCFGWRCLHWRGMKNDTMNWLECFSVWLFSSLRCRGSHKCDSSLLQNTLGVTPVLFIWGRGFYTEEITSWKLLGLIKLQESVGYHPLVITVPLFFAHAVVTFNTVNFLLHIKYFCFYFNQCIYNLSLYEFFCCHLNFTDLFHC